MVVVAALPATSVAWMVMVFDPGTRVRLQERFPFVTVVAWPLQVTAARPERASEIVPSTVICGVVTVAPAMGEVTLIRGAVLSILRVKDAVAEFPAPSVAVREMT